MDSGFTANQASFSPNSWEGSAIQGLSERNADVLGRPKVLTLEESSEEVGEVTSFRIGLGGSGRVDLLLSRLWPTGTEVLDESIAI